MQRNLAIDGFRGLLLLIIAINHIGSYLLTPYTREPLGFVSAAEGFVFLSGWMAAVVYSRYLDQPREMHFKILKRIGVIFAFLMAGVITVVLIMHSGVLEKATLRIWQGEFGLRNYFKYPFKSIMLTATQLMQMPYHDILVLYMVPMLFLGGALQLLKAKLWYVVIMLSIVVWWLAQSWDQSMVKPIYAWVQKGMRLNLGYLDVLAWQLLFFAGVVSGYLSQVQKVKWLQVNVWAFFVVFFIAAAFFYWRHFGMSSFMPQWLQRNNTQELSLLRIINSFLLAYIFACLIKWLPILFKLPYLTFIGQHSLQVFVFHSVALFLFKPWLGQYLYQWKWDLGITLLFVLSLLIPAFLHWMWRRFKSLRAKNALS